MFFTINSFIYFLFWTSLFFSNITISTSTLYLKHLSILITFCLKLSLYFDYLLNVSLEYLYSPFYFSLERFPWPITHFWVERDINKELYFKTSCEQVGHGSGFMTYPIILQLRNPRKNEVVGIMSTLSFVFHLVCFCELQKHENKWKNTQIEFIIFHVIKIKIN